MLKCINDKARMGVVSRKVVNDVTALVQAFLATNPGAPQSQAALHALRVVRQRYRHQRQQVRLTNQALRRVKTMRNIHAMATAAGGKRTLAAYFRSLLDRDTDDQIGSRFGNVEGRWRYHENIAFGLWDDGIEALRGKGFFRRNHDMAAMNDFIDEVFLLFKGTGQSTGNPMAAQIAQSWKAVDRYLFGSARRVGAAISDRHDFIVPNFHEPSRVRGKSRNITDVNDPDRLDWIDFVRRNTNVPESLVTGLPMTPQEHTEFLSDSWAKIASDGWIDVHTGTKTGQGYKAKMGDRHSFERRIDFKDAQAWRAYDEKYGTGGQYFDTFTGHIKQRSREIAIMEMLGPSPDAVMEKMVAWAKASEKVAGRDETNKEIDSFQSVYEQLYGRMSLPAQGVLGRGLEAMRAYLPSAQLSGATLSSVTDFATTEWGARFVGLSRTRLFADTLRRWVTDIDTDRRFALRIGIGVEDWTNAQLGAARAQLDREGPRLARSLTDAAMRLSLLTQKTNTSREACAMEFMRHWGEEVHDGKAFTQLNENMQRALQMRGIGPSEWAAISQQTPLMHRGIPTLSLLAVAQQDPNLAVRLSQVISEELEFMIPTGTARVKSIVRAGALTPGGLKGNTLGGQLFMSAAQYKSFPLLIITQHLRRLMNTTQYRSRGERWTEFGIFFTELTIMGFIALQIKSITQGKEPIDPTKNPAKTFMASALNGGALGFYGDMLFKDVNEFGGGTAGMLLGPTFSGAYEFGKLTLGNLQQAGLQAGAGKDIDTNFGREATRFAKTYTPFSNLWQTRIIADRVIWDTMQNILDPDAQESWRQMEVKQQQQFGSGFQVRPGELYR